MNMAEILRVKNLTVKFGENVVVDNLSFDVQKGESLAIIGPNGSGKTVLLRALVGFLPHEGTVEWSKTARIGYVPQKVDLDRKIPMTVMKLLHAKAALLGVKRPEINSIVKSVNLAPRVLTEPIGNLSSGQLQRALVTFALLGHPNVILFDEPTASMDQPGEEQTYELIHRLQDEMDVTPIVVSHDLSFVYKYATQVLCLNRQGLCFGEPRTALTPDLLEKLYGVPAGFYHHLHEEEHEKMHHHHLEEMENEKKHHHHG
jgi:zinc transport system ATP-binding protein